MLLSFQADATSLRGGSRPVSMPAATGATINSMTITKSEGRRLSTRLDPSGPVRGGSEVETAETGSVTASQVKKPAADGFEIGMEIGSLCLFCF